MAEGSTEKAIEDAVKEAGVEPETGATADKVTPPPLYSQQGVDTQERAAMSQLIGFLHAVEQTAQQLIAASRNPTEGRTFQIIEQQARSASSVLAKLLAYRLGQQ